MWIQGQNSNLCNSYKLRILVLILEFSRNLKYFRFLYFGSKIPLLVCWSKLGILILLEQKRVLVYLFCYSTKRSWVIKILSVLSIEVCWLSRIAFFLSLLFFVVLFTGTIHISPKHHKIISFPSSLQPQSKPLYKALKTMHVLLSIK